MKQSQRKLPLRTSIKARLLNLNTQWAAGGQTGGKMTAEQQKLMAGYLRYLERNRKQ